ncbi:hypothetical protein FA15DRAFT_665516 [Coprinopsis marcescibilis]|uniref:Uncharacterized protein n=1 Tax=Coprinopsis marcescibilis TaxID=230819 RepID=A0A5C3L6C6_COPMA|nr:hypothetical protein FA15DRAFT_665516 [Coprinopsis marcescibilis]
MSSPGGGNSGGGSPGGGGGSQGNPIARITIAYAESNVQLISIGLQLFMCMYGFVVFLETPHSNRKGRIMYILASFSILALTVISTVANNVTNYNTLLNAVPGDPMGTRAAMNRFGQGTIAYAVARISSTFIAFVGDGLLLYRCYFFWYDRKWVVVLPALVYVASVVMGVLQMLWEDIFSAWVIDFSVAWISLNASLNALITATISFRLVMAYYKNRQYLPAKASKVYLSVVAILVEAALPLSVAGIVLAVFMNQSRGSGATGVHQGFFRILYFFLLAISPQMIIFRVTTGRAAGRDIRGTSGNTTRISTGLDFAHSSVNDDTNADFEISSTPKRRRVDVIKSDKQSHIERQNEANTQPMAV